MVTPRMISGADGYCTRRSREEQRSLKWWIFLTRCALEVMIRQVVEWNGGAAGGELGHCGFPPDLTSHWQTSNTTINNLFLYLLGVSGSLPTDTPQGASGRGHACGVGDSFEVQKAYRDGVQD